MVNQGGAGEHSARDVKGSSKADLTPLASRPFELSESEATRIWEEMRETVAGWREHFAGHGVTKREMEEFRHRFALAEGVHA